MLRKIVVLLVMMCMYSGTVFAGYPYENVCPHPSGGRYNKNPDGTINPNFHDGDQWGFWKCECVSYTAYKIDDEWNALTDGSLRFDNFYKQPSKPAGEDWSKKYKWSDGSNWDNAAKRAGIKVDKYPIPGDIAYWENLGGYGHVAFVESVEYDDNMKATKVHISEYNYSPAHGRDARPISPDNPSGYIHIMASQEGLTSYYFNRMDAQWSFPEQTEEEWAKIFLLVWSQYKKDDNNGNQSIFEQTWYAYGGLPSGMGGGMGGSYTSPSGNYTSNGTGATEHSQPGESDHQGYVHNVSMDDTEMDISGVGNYNNEWTFVHGEVPVVNIRVRLKNKTNHKIGRNDVTIKWFESPNHTFNPQYDHHFATDHNRESIGPFKHHSHSDELVERKANLN